ncbi:hypothetical protein [Desulfosporosinus youngiae]|uniref:Uncharacterized protein n=1 Tax=Desulfosporosinus youngiae DSM 17734 TaxID=768710 RepID=H5XZE8_9FIRM|nr:hypothetical protein [Desulfosporosinus youngiae]EHQ91854.1 hypothetical protein DesyoDRAFT_4913 [Desulfosporosinus youngiae DSM 17734]
MTFQEFVERYKNELGVNVSSLEELLEYAQKSHRFKNLLFLYMLKDKGTFNRMVELSHRNRFAKKMVTDSKQTLKRLNNGELYDNQDMKKLVSYLNKTVIRNLQPLDGHMEDWEFNGYSKILNSYLVEERKRKLDVNLRNNVHAKMKSVDWNNLFVSKN